MSRLAWLLPTSDRLFRMILGPEAVAGYITKLRRDPGQNFLIREGCSSLKPCERNQGDGKGRRETVGEGLREETAPKRGMPSLLKEWKGLFGGINLSIPLAVDVSRPHCSQFSDSGDGLLDAVTFSREVCPRRLDLRAVTSPVTLTPFLPEDKNTHNYLNRSIPLLFPIINLWLLIIG